MKGCKDPESDYDLLVLKCGIGSRRATLSLALKDDRLNVDMIHAFVEGYSQHWVLALSDMADALRLSWCIEVPWWIQPEFLHEKRQK